MEIQYKQLQHTHHTYIHFTICCVNMRDSHRNEPRNFEETFLAQPAHFHVLCFRVCVKRVKRDAGRRKKNLKTPNFSFQATCRDFFPLLFLNIFLTNTTESNANVGNCHECTLHTAHFIIILWFTQVKVCIERRIATQTCTSTRCTRVQYTHIEPLWKARCVLEIAYKMSSNINAFTTAWSRLSLSLLLHLNIKYVLRYIIFLIRL